MAKDRRRSKENYPVAVPLADGRTHHLSEESCPECASKENCVNAGISTKKDLKKMRFSFF